MSDLRRLKPALWIVAALGAALPASAWSATTVGETFLPSQICGSPITFFQTTSPGGQYAVSADGVMTSWSFRAAASPPQLKFKVARAAPGPTDRFTIVGEGNLETPTANGLNTYPIRISVEAGDVIGIYAATDGACGRASPSYGYHVIADDAALGTTGLYTEVPPGPFSTQLSVAATLEPDADADGFGDETQDLCPTDATRQGDCTPPETTITKGAPSKTDRSKVKFKFKSSESASTFECKLDKKKFKPCTSPRTVKNLDEAKHRFKVRAIDAAGNVDPSPAKDKFKVVG